MLRAPGSSGGGAGLRAALLVTQRGVRRQTVVAQAGLGRVLRRWMVVVVKGARAGRQVF
jgi:hypothetical protein